MTKFLTLAAAAVAGLVLTSGASAREPQNSQGASAQLADAQPADMGATAQPKKETRYCVIDTVTGSRIPHKVCMTRKEWIAERDFDPLNP